MKATSIEDLQYADDCGIAAHTETDLHNTLATFAEAHQLLGLSINATKTKVIFQPAHPLTATAPNNDTEGTRVATSRRQTSMSKFNTGADARVCIRHAERLHDIYMRLQNGTKILVYMGVILTTLLGPIYGCETRSPTVTM